MHDGTMTPPNAMELNSFPFSSSIQEVTDYVPQRTSLDKKRKRPAKAPVVSGYTQLMQAIDMGQTVVCDNLLAEGANVNALRQSDRRSALHLACLTPFRHDKQLQLVELLLRWDANVHQKDMFGDTPFLLACWAGNIPVMEVLLRHDDKVAKATDGNGCSAPMMAAKRNKGEVMNRLIGVMPPLDLNLQDSLGFTAMHWAVSTGSKAAARALLRQKRRVRHNLVNHKGETPTHLAAREGHEDILEELFFDRTTTQCKAALSARTPVNAQTAAMVGVHG